jgi:hypothetical protein
MKKKWQEERGDNVVLKDAANRLNLQMQDVKKRAEQKERRHEETKTGVLGVWLFLGFVDAFADQIEFTGAG